LKDRGILYLPTQDPIFAISALGSGLFWQGQNSTQVPP
jgi:hypothetical protein